MGDDLTAAWTVPGPAGTELIAFRRDLHAHPEPGRRNTAPRAWSPSGWPRRGWAPWCFPGHRAATPISGRGGPRVALRADLDALPMDDEKGVPYRSTIRRDVPRLRPRRAHGHAGRGRPVPGRAGGVRAAARRVRLIFQPAEEAASGAKAVIAAGALESVGRIFALHCDPRLDAGKLGVRSGAITAACDKVKVACAGPGGHTARPHLTADVVYALGKIVTELPAALSRRVDPRAGLSLVWGHMSAGSAANAIPDEGVVEGTVRCLDTEVWRGGRLFEELVQSVAAPMA